MSKPTTSSMPGSSGRRSRTRSRPCRPRRAGPRCPTRGGTRGARCAGWTPRPRSRSRCRSRTCRSRSPCACAYSIGSAQSVPPNGRSDDRRRPRRPAAGAARSRAASGRPSPTYHCRRSPAFQPRSAGVEADDLVSLLGRRRHERHRGRRITRRQARDAGDRAARPSSPTRRARAAGACPPARRSRTPRRTRRRARRRPRAPASTRSGRARRDPTVRPERRQHRDRVHACPPEALARRRAARPPSPSPPSPASSRPTRVIVARLRISAVIGMSSSSASQTAGDVRCSVFDRLARQAGTRGRARPSRAASSAA